MKKRVYLMIYALLVPLMSVSPVFAHGGDERNLIDGISINVALFGISTLLALGIVGVNYRVSSKPMTKLQYGISALGGIVAFIHLGLGLRGDLLLFLNGLGYLALGAMLFLPISFIDGKRHLVRWVLIGYTAVTIVGYFLLHGLSGSDNLGLLTKALELGLIVCLVMRIGEVSTSSSSINHLQTEGETGGD